MDLLAPIKKAVNKVKDAIDKKQSDDEQRTELQKWQTKLQNAKSTYNYQIMDEREYIYLGTRTVDPNINSTALPSKQANNIYNIVYEMIDSQVNTQVPQPSVKSKRPGFDEQSRMIEDSITNDLKENEIERINDINERITPKQGFSVVTVEWDPDLKHHCFSGDIKLGWKHPKQLVPQPKVFELQKMDYFFILSSVTKEYVQRRYGVELTSQNEQYPEMTSLADADNATSQYINNMNEKVTEIVCWYKDADCDICKYVWTDDTVLEDLPKYFHRRLNRCTQCGWVNNEDADVCPECGNKKFKVTIEEYETLVGDTTIGMIDKGTGERMVIPAGTQIPYYVPRRYPFSIRINTPEEFAFGGQSDVDVIRDQQDSIKKVLTKAEEKIIKSGSLVKVPDSLNVSITNETYQIVRGNIAELSGITTEDLTVPVAEEMNYIQEMRQFVQYQLGITNSYQGLQDDTAKSGVAKQIQVQQASGRMQSKMYNKFGAYKELFEIMFEFKLAFYDELRPYVTQDENGNDIYGDFNKYLFLMQDADGNFYYNTDFMFSADAGAGLPKDPMFVYQQALQQAQFGLINQLQYWTILESIHFPMATQIKQQIQQQQQMAQQQAMQQQQMAQQQQQQQQGQPPHPNDVLSRLDPQTQQKFASMDPGMQQQLMAQAMGGAGNG